MSEAHDDAAAPALPTAKSKPALIVILLAVNTVAALAAVGMLYYKAKVFKRAPITESSEAERLKKKFTKPALVGPPGSLKFDAVTINLAQAPSGTGGENRIHYATLAFSVATADQTAQSKLEEIRPLLQDRLISMVSKKQYGELNSVQGRYLLRTQLRELGNQLAREPLITDVYFTEFVVQ